MKSNIGNIFRVLCLLLVVPHICVANDFEIGWQLLTDARFDEAQKRFQALYKKCDARGAFGLGVMRQFGYGSIAQDYDVALRLYKEAAAVGLAPAMHNIGFFYQHGLGVTADDREAVRWYELSSAKGFPQSQFDLAYMYINARGVAKDDERALELLKLASRSGIADAFYDVGALYSLGRGTAKDMHQAYAYVKAGALLNSELATKNIAWFASQVSNKDIIAGDKWAARTVRDLQNNAHTSPNMLLQSIPATSLRSCKATD